MALVFALANVPLLLLPPTPAEQPVWRKLDVQRLRRWLTRRRNPTARHRDGTAERTARTNIRWHAVLSMILAGLILHPSLKTAPPGVVRYALPAGCIAYFAGSIVQRQKIVIAANERHRRRR